MYVPKSSVNVRVASVSQLRVTTSCVRTIPEWIVVVSLRIPYKDGLHQNTVSGT